MTEHEVKYTQSIVVKVDETKFTEEWMAEFRKHFHPYMDVTDHVEHIGRAYINELVSSPDDFLEGYGKLSEFGVTFLGYINEETEAWIE